MGFFVPGPAPTGHSIVHIVEEHAAQAFAGLLAAIEQQAEATVDDLAPAHPATIVDGYPGGTTETVADQIVDRHVGGVVTTVINIAGFPKGLICAAHIMVVPALDHRGGNLPVGDGPVEGLGNFLPPLRIRIEDPG